MTSYSSPWDGHLVGGWCHRWLWIGAGGSGGAREGGEEGKRRNRGAQCLTYGGEDLALGGVGLLPSSALYEVQAIWVGIVSALYTHL